MPIEHNKLDTVERHFHEGNMDLKNISNHSLSATSISCMYRASVLIMEKSGHLSKEGLKSYEHTLKTQVMSICKELSSSIWANQSKPNIVAVSAM